MTNATERLAALAVVSARLDVRGDPRYWTVLLDMLLSDIDAR